MSTPTIFYRFGGKQKADDRNLEKKFFPSFCGLFLQLIAWH